MTARVSLGKTSSAMEKTVKAYRNGQHATMYELMRDPSLNNKDVIRDKTVPVFPFIGGSSYKGQWSDDRKDGFGTQIYADGTKYEGEWKDNKRHGNGTFFTRKGKRFIQQYIGYWEEGVMQGLGTYNYENGEVYEGNWRNNKRSGEGKIKYPNGDYYIGEWANDAQNGFGSLYLSNGNIYEGQWSHGKKEGSGKFFYASTSKVYEGEWVDDQPKCGEYRAPVEEEDSFFGEPTVRKQYFELPEIGLQNARAVLDLATSEVRLTRSSKQGLGDPVLSPEALQRAEKLFDSLDTACTGIVSMWNLLEVFASLGLDMSIDDLREIGRQLDVGPDASLSFPETVDIATFLINDMS